MITNEFEKEYKTSKLELCAGCGKPSTDDDLMVRLTFEYGEESKHICLCRICRNTLYQKL